MPEISPNLTPIFQPPLEPVAIPDQLVVKTPEEVEDHIGIPDSEEETTLPEADHLEESLALKSGIAHPADAADKATTDENPPPLAKKEKAKFKVVVETGEKIVSVAGKATSHAQSFAETAQEKHLAKGASSLVEVFNVPVGAGRVALTKQELKKTRAELKLKKQEASELLKSPPSEERDSQYLLIQQEIDELKGKAEKLSQKILKGSVGVAKATVKSATGMAAFVSTAKGQLGDVKIASSFRSTGLQAVNLASKVASLVEQGKKYKELSNDLKESKALLETLRTSGQENSELFLTTEKRVDKIQKEMSALRGSIVENSIITTGNLAETIGAVADTLLTVGPHIGISSTTATQILSTVSASVPIATGVVGMVLNGKQIADNVATDTALTVEIEKLKRIIPTTPQPLQDILQMRLHNLEFQREENLISVIQNTFTLFSGALGTTASAIAVVGVTTGIVGVVGATAGVGAGIVAGSAVAIGGGYYIYKNHLYMTAKAKSAIHDAKQKVLGTQIKVTEYLGARQEQSVQKKVGMLATQRLDAKIQKQEIQSEFSRKIEPLLDSLHEKNKDLSVLIDLKNTLERQRDSIDSQRHAFDFQNIQRDLQYMQTDINALEQDIKSLNAEIEKLTRLASHQAVGKLTSETKSQKAIAEQLEKVNDANAKIIGLRQQKQIQDAKELRLKDNLENHAISASMSGKTPAEVAEFKQNLSQALEDPANADSVRQFLESQEIEIKEDDLLKGCLSFIVKSN